MPFELCLSVLISVLFLIILLLFTSLDISSNGYMNRPANKISNGDTYSAPPGSENFILAKNWSQDPLFVVTSFLSILIMSSEFSIGHAFHLFNLIFSVVTSFMLLSEEKYQKIKRKRQRIPKNNDSPKIEKKESGKSGTISRGAHREWHLSCVCVC